MDNYKKPSGWQYVRNPFKPKQYTALQTREMRAVRRVYVECLKYPCFPKPDQTPLALENEEACQPKYSIDDCDLSFLTSPKQPSELFSAAEGAVRLIVHYLQIRDNRRWRAGHRNDPTRLTCATLKIQFEQLAQAGCTNDTAEQLVQLRHWLIQLRSANGGQPIFQNETDAGDGSFDRLLQNLLLTLSNLQASVKRRLALTSAREQFKQLHVQQKTLLNTLIQYLFRAMSNTPKNINFSLINAQYSHDKSLREQLDSREGVLLKNIMYAPAVKRLLQCNGENTYLGGITPVFKSSQCEILAEWLNDTGQPNPYYLLALVDFKPSRLTPSYQKDLNNTLPQKDFSTYSKQIKAALTSDFLNKKSTLCPALKTDNLLPFIKLHGLTEIFVEYCEHTEALSDVAGFWGDQLIYDQIGHLVQRLMEEAKTLIDVFSQTLQRLNAANQTCYNDCVDNGRHRQWCKNHTEAGLLLEAINQQINDYKVQLEGLLRVIREPALYSKKCRYAKKALHTAMTAVTVLNKRRQQMGLPAMEEDMDILELKQSPQQFVARDHVEKTPAPMTESTPLRALSKTETVNDVTPYLTAIYKETYQSDFTKNNQLTVHTFAEQFKAALSIVLCCLWHFRGTRARHHFAKKAKSSLHGCFLLCNNQDLTSEQLNDLENKLNALQKTATDLRKTLCWPFHNQAQKFLDDWLVVINKLLVKIANLRSSADYKESNELLSQIDQTPLINYRQQQAQHLDYKESTGKSVEGQGAKFKQSSQATDNIKKQSQIMSQRTEQIIKETKKIEKSTKRFDDVLENNQQCFTQLKSLANDIGIGDLPQFKEK